MRYKQHRNGPKGTIRTYFEDSTLLARRTGLSVANMEASILSGTAVGIRTQTYDSTNNELRYQLSFDQAGTAVVRVTTTFTGSDETHISDYKVKVLDNTLPMSDYV